MKKRFTLTEAQQEMLRNNQNVASVSARMVQYTPAFKRTVLREHAQGKQLSEIFINANIPIAWFSRDHAREKYSEWKRIRDKHGDSRFDIDARGNTGTATLLRYHTKGHAYKAMNDTEKIAYLEAENDALEYIRRHFQLPPSIRHR